MGVKERYEAKKNNLKSNSTSVKADSTTTGVKERYEAKKAKNKLLSTINFDTFETDLSSMGKTIGDIYNGWQTQETMKNTLSSVQNMYDRLGKYQEYQKQYGGVDLSELQSNYKSILDGWEDVAKTYSRYKSADAYNNALKSAEKQAKDYEGMKTADLGAVQKEVADLEKIFGIAKGYDDKAVDFSKKSINIRNASAIDGFSKSLKKLTDERDTYLKSVGYENMDALEKALGEKKMYYGKAQRVQDGIALSSVADVNSENYDKNFNKYAEKGKVLGKEKEKGVFSSGYKNQIAYLRENPEALADYEDISDENGAIIGSVLGNQMTYVAAKYMTDDEARLYNYYLGKGDEEGAENYLKAIEESLKQRQGSAIYKERESNLSKYTFGATAGIDQFTQGIINEFNTKDDYIPTTGIQNASGLVREDIKYEDGTLGQVGYDLINTTSNMMPSILTSAVIGTVNPVVGGYVGAGLMGTSAAGNAYQEMLNLGYDKGQARTYSNLVGLSEAGLQSVMGGIGKLGGVSGKLSKIVSGIDNGLAKFAVRWGGSALSEGFEEAAQEVLAPIFQNLAAGYDTGAEVDWSEVVYSGLLGALSGGVLEGGDVAVNTYAESSFNKNMGKNIKANERVADMFDIASTSPEISSAYEAYTHYANKGINADNITDAQLGRLYSSAKADAVETISSKKTTDEQKQNAMKTLARLSVVDTENTLAKEAREKLNIGEETKETKSGVAVDVKDLKIRVNGDDVTVATDNGKISVDDMTLAQNDAELVILAEGIAKTDGEDVANLFLNQYDGKTEVEEYANSFNLTMAYAKNNFTYETILNKKGALSTKQVKAIYEETRIKADKERAKTIEKLNKKMADKKFYKGFIDDSVIDYENTSADGKVNWNDLNSRQKQAVTFIKGFAQATGMNLVLEHNPESKHGGKYEVRDNTITIDIANYYDRVGNLRETIIPTMSHETTHWMREKSPELWRNLNEIVFSTLTEHYNSNTEQAIKDKIELLDRLEPHKKHTEEDAKERTISEEDLIQAEMNRKGNSEEVSREEIIARACEDMLKMSEQGRKIFFSLSEAEQKTLVGKIKSLINDLLNWVNDLLSSYESTSTEARIMREYQAELKKASKVWDEMLKKSVEANQSLEKSGAYENSNATDGDVKYSQRIDKKRKTNYNEYQTNALIWARSTSTNPGDLNILNANGKYFALIKATEDGFIELAKGNYKEVQAEYERAYRKANNEIYGNLESYESDQGTDIWDMQLYGKGSDGNGNTQQIESQGLQNNSTGNNEHLWNSDKGEFGKSEVNEEGIRFSMRENVEETKELIAVHNMQVSELERTLDLGGLPMPSIAIIKAKSGHSEYGDVSLVFPKSTIDPKADKNNKVYGGDAWTPTYPTIEYKPNEKVSKRINDKYYEFSRKFGYDESRPLYNYVYDMEDILNRHKGEAEMIAELYEDTRMMQVYLLDTGKNKVETIQKEVRAELTDAEVEMNDYFIKELGADVVDAVMWDGNGTPMSYRKNYLSKYEDAIRDAYKKLLSEEYHFTDEQVQNVLDSTKNADLIRFMRDAHKYRENGRVTIKTEDDYEATKKAIKDAAGEDYRKWIDSLFKGIEEKSGIRNNVDYFTNSGNRRSWEALHWENNLENVIKVMKSQDNGVAALFSGHAIWAVSAKDYRSIDEIKADSDRLKQLPEEEYNKIKEGFGERFQEIAHSIMDKSERNPFIAADNAMECIVDAVRNSKTKSGILNQLKQYQQLTVTQTTVDDIVSLVNDISNMPTEYFEAKPKRAVELNEIATAIIPDSTSESTKARLGDMGIKYLEYENGNEQSRLDALNSLEDVRFSDRDSSYLDAVSRGDMETAKRMVIESAKKSGFKYTVFHGTGNFGFTEFVKDGFGGLKAFFFTDQNKVAQTYSGVKGVTQLSAKEKVGNYDVALDIKKPLVIDCKGAKWDKIPFAVGKKRTTTTNYLVKYAEKQGYDGVIFKNIVDVGTNISLKDELSILASAEARAKWSSTVYAVFNSNQIKSLDAVTYDDNGDVIPLSERFNKQNDNIRYADRDLNTLSENQLWHDSVTNAMKLENLEWQIEKAQKSTDVQYLNKLKNELLDAKEKYVAYGETILKRAESFSVDKLQNYAYGLRFAESSIEAKEYTLEKFKNSLQQRINEYRELFGKTDDKSYDEGIWNVARLFFENELGLKYIDGDVLYSDRDDTSVYDLMGEKARLLKENEKFKAEIERLNERLKLERKVTKGNFFNENQLGAVAGHLRNISKSNIDKVELMKDLKDVYSFIAHSPDLTWEEVFEKCYRIANNMLAEAKHEVVVDDYSKRILREIRETRISLDESQKKEASYIFGKNWNRYFFGKVILADDGISIDSKWQEWAEQYPDIFEAGISDGDMIGELYDIINNLRDASETIAEYDTEEQTRWLAREIYNQYWNVSPIRTTADKYDKQIKRLNFEHRNAMKEFREEYNSRLKKQHKADKEKYAELVAKIRERKDKEIASAKEHGKEMLSKYRENAERKTRIQSITANALTLNKWLTKNSKDYHIHEAMKGPVIKLLQAIDFSSNSQLEKGVPTQIDASFAEAFSEVKTMLVNAENMVEGLEALYGHDLAETIDLLSKAAFRLVGDNNYIINKLSVEELKSLDKLVRHIKKVVTDLNKFHTVHHNQGAVNLANEFMEYGDKLGKLKKQDGDIGKFLKFRNRTPYYFFKALGKPGKKLFEAFQDGWDKLAFNAKKVIDFAEETYTAKEVKEWSKETKEFTITQLDGSSRTFNMTIAQIMALHCVFKQEDAQRHLLSSGMTLKRFDSKGNVVADYENIRLTISDINSILGTLNDRQREVADALQKFMNTVCATWGNEISMARFGIEMFGIPDYFPIKVSESTVPTDNSKEIDAASLFRLLNMSFTKSRNKYAEQSIEIGDIFNIFAQHTSDMAKYNALALPVLDFNKWYSIHGKDMSNKEYGVVNTLKTVFGDEANVYLRRFVRDLNGSQNVSRDAIGKKFFKNSKVAAVANNLRVILLQPTAYLKASAEMDNKYLLKAKGYVKVNPISLFGKLKKAVENAEKYCGIVQWKSLGYYDTDISKGIAEKIKHADTFKDKAIEKSLKGAELADKATFGTLWIACEFEIRDKHPELNPGTEEFYKKVGLRLREVIYATQVVDSTMTRSDMMRSPDGLDKMFTTFGSEPTIAYNMLLDLAMQYNLDKRELGSRKEALKKNGKKIRKVVTAYVITNALAALVESGFDAFRDDDDDEMDAEKFLKLYFKNFALDLSIGNKLPYVKELYSILQGYSSSRLDTQWMEYLNRLVVIGYKVAEGKGEGQGAKAVNYILKLASSFVGYGFYNAYRDMMATLNKLDLFTTEDLNEMFDDFFN